MFLRFATRVFARNYAFSGPLTGLRIATAARQHVIARTLLTTAPVADPAARKSASDDKPKAKRSTAGTNKKSAGGRTKSKPKPKPKSKSKSKSKKAQDPDKVQERKVKALAKARRARLKQRQEQAKNDPNARFKGALRSLKLRKDELPPKFLQSPYSVFVSENFATLRKELPAGGADDIKARFAEVNKEIAQRWKSMSDEEKKPYIERAAAYKEAGLKAIDEWYRKTDPRIVKAVRLQKKRKLPLKASDLRRPAPAFVKFYKDNYAKIEVPANMSGREHVVYRLKQIAEMWRNVPAAEKNRMKEQYNKEMEEYRKHGEAVRTATPA
ncbi:hypothetical protein BD414DRAFT_499163 [Trametes punicea]|nr:hypothetical protein BD414DRAFT_499163 [Trametes punicea]